MYIPKTSILQAFDLYLQIKQERAFQPLQLPISHNRESTQVLHFLSYGEMGGFMYTVSPDDVF